MKKHNSVCPECGWSFYCGAKDGKNECWCFDVKTPVLRDPNALDCLCQECLTRQSRLKWDAIVVWIGGLLFCAIAWIVIIKWVMSL